MSTTPVTQEMIRQQNSSAVSEAQKGAWIKLAEVKNNLSADLTKRELALQGIVLNVPDDGVVAAMAAYKKGHDELVAERMKFTNVVREKLIDSMMLVEKRTDPKTNTAYLELSARELAIRKAANASAQLEQNKATEKANFKAHFQNQYMEIGAKYRTALRQIIQDAYVACLHAKTPPDEIDSVLAVSRLAMVDVKCGTPEKFVRTHLSTEEGAALYKTLPPFNKSSIFEEIHAELTEKFSMYAHDLANANAAIENSQRTFSATIVEEQRELKQEQAANVLMASAESFIISDVKAVKKLERIVIEDNSESWVAKIMAAFMANFAVAFAKTKNKKYSSLSIAQMAAALDAADVTVDGVKYETIEK